MKSTSPRLIRRSRLALSIALAAMTVPAAASKLEEIVVTATKRDETLKDVAMAIDVTTGEQIQKLNLVDFKDIQQLSPGLEMTNNDGRTNTATLRGISYNPDTGADPAVDVYINETPIDPQNAFTAIYDIAQIEVLRGPQGSLRGRTAPAGAITLTTRRANLSQLEGYVQGSISDQNAHNLQGAISIPLIEDQLAIRLSGLNDQNDSNQVKNITRDQRSSSKTKSYRITLDWMPIDDLDVSFMYQDLDARNRVFQQVMGPGNQPSLLDPARSGPAIDEKDRYAVSEGDALFETRTKIYTLGMDWDIADHTLSFIAGHQENLLKQQRDYDPTNAVPDYVPMQRVHTPYKLWTGELRFASNMNDFWNYTFGVFYQDAENPVKVSQPSNMFFANAAPPTPFPVGLGLFIPIQSDIDVPVSIRNQAIFTAQSFQFTDELKLELGLRYAEIDTSQQSTLTVSSPGFPPFAPPFVIGPTDTIAPKSAKRTERPVTGGASLSYQFSPDVNLYVSYGRSFRPGTAAVGYTVQLDQDLLLIDPEKSDSIEFGVKSNLFDGRVKFNAALFYQKFDGYISQSEANIAYASGKNGVVDGSGLFNFGGDATSQGIEIQADALITDNWVAGINASYVEAKYDDARAPCNDFNGDGEPDGEGLPFVPVGQQVSFCTLDGRIAEVPSFNLSMNSEYSFPLGAVEPFVRGVLTYRPGFSSERANYDYDSFTLLNVFLGVRDPDNRWEVALFAKNLLDQEKISNISIGTGTFSTVNFDQTAGAPFDSGYRQINLTLPREIGLSTRYNF